MNYNLGQSRAHKKFMKDLCDQVDFLNSPFVQEFHLCMVAQGYEERVWYDWTMALGSGFPSLEIIKDLRSEINSNGGEKNSKY